MEEDVDLHCNSLHPQARAPDDPLHDQRLQYASRDSIYPAVKFQGFPQIITSISFYINSCLKTTSIDYPAEAVSPTYWE